MRYDEYAEEQKRPVPMNAEDTMDKKYAIRIQARSGRTTVIAEEITEDESGFLVVRGTCDSVRWGTFPWSAEQNKRSRMVFGRGTLTWYLHKTYGLSEDYVIRRVLAKVMKWVLQMQNERAKVS